MELPIAHVIPNLPAMCFFLNLALHVCSIFDIRLALSMLIAPALSIVPLSLLFKTLNETMSVLDYK